MSYRDSNNDVVIDQFYLESKSDSSILQYLKLRELGSRSCGKTSPLERSISLTYLVHSLVIPSRARHFFFVWHARFRTFRKCLGRSLLDYESEVLRHLFNFETRNDTNTLLSQEQIDLCYIRDIGILPITFIELLEVLYRRGVDFSCDEGRGHTFLEILLILMKILVHPFIRHGYCCKEAVQKFCSARIYRMCFNSYRDLQTIFAVFQALVEATPDLQDIPKKVSQSHLWKVFRAISSSIKTPTHSDLLQVIMDPKRDLLKKHGNELLLTVCASYDCEDLPEVVKQLLDIGFDVNQLCKSKENALIKLAYNRPNYRAQVYEAARILIERGIDVNHVDCNNCNAMMHFFMRCNGAECCRYQNLVNLNNSKFWDTIILLLDAGCSVIGRCVRDKSVIAIALEVSDGSTYGIYPHRSTICSKCALQDFAIVTTDVAVEKRGLEHFTPFLYVLERIIIKAGISFTRLTYVRDISLLPFVCMGFKGEELVALIRLLCRYGINVNIRSLLRPESLPFPL